MKQIIYLILGLILGAFIAVGVIKFFKIQLFPVFAYNAKLDTSPNCGELTKAMYCYKGNLCELRCNLCNCEIPYCQLDVKMCPQPK